jgi:hypothetical protein
LKNEGGCYLCNSLAKISEIKEHLGWFTSYSITWAQKMVWGELRNWCEYFCAIGPSLILQSIGFFVPNWVTTETCDAIGLFYRCCGKNDIGCVVDGADTCKTFLLYIYILKVIIKIVKEQQQQYTI